MKIETVQLVRRPTQSCGPGGCLDVVIKLRNETNQRLFVASKVRNMNYDDATKTLTLDYVGTEPLGQGKPAGTAAAPADCELRVKTLEVSPNAEATVQETSIPVVSRQRPFLGAGKGFGPEVVIDRSNVEHVRVVTVFASSQFVADESESGQRLREHLRSWGNKLDVTVNAKLR